MPPLLYRDEAGAVEPSTGASDQCGGQGLVTFRVFGAVDIAGQVLAVAIAEGVDRLFAAKRRGEQLLQRATSMQQVAVVVATQPQPQRGGGRWDVDAGVGVGREGV